MIRLNENNIQRIDVISETIKNYQDTIQKLEVLLLYKVKKEREVFKELIHSENSFNYFQLMLKKDSLEYQIIHLKDIIYTGKKRSRARKKNLISALETKDQKSKKIKKR